MSKEKIKITKKLYSRFDVSNVLDLSFSELAETDNRKNDVKIKNLFQEYNDLFYDIPKIGNQSHSTLFVQSRDYINDFYDPKDDQIEALLDRIEILEEEVLNQQNSSITSDNEHPIYNNGSFLRVEGSSNPNFRYFMYKGLAHYLTNVTKKILYQKYQPGRDENDFIITLSSDNELPTQGPQLRDGQDLNNLE